MYVRSTPASALSACIWSSRRTCFSASVRASSGSPARVDLGAQLLHLLAVDVAVAQLALDLAQLLAQVVVALGLRHLLARLVLDLRLHLQDADLLLQRLVDAAEALPSARPAPAAPAPRAPSASGSTRPGRPSAPDRRRSARPSTARAGSSCPAPTACRCSGAPSAAAPRRSTERGQHAVVGALEAHAVARAVRHEALDARAAQPLHQHLQPALGQLAHAHDHPDRCRRDRTAAGVGSSALGSRCATRKQSRSSDSSALATASIETGRVTRSGTIMYGKTTRSRIGSSGSTSGICGSPSDCRHSSSRAYSITGCKNGPSRAQYIDRRFIFSSTNAIEVVRHRPDSAEAIGDHVPHLARPGSRARPGRTGGASPVSRRSPLLVATQARDLAVDGQPAHGKLSRPQRPPVLAVEARQPRRRWRPRSRRRGPRAIACTSSLASPSFSLQLRSWPSCQRLTPASDA